MTGRDLHVEDNSKDSLEVALQSISKDEIISTCKEGTGEAASHFLTKIKAVKTPRCCKRNFKIVFQKCQ